MHATIVVKQLTFFEWDKMTSNKEQGGVSRDQLPTEQMSRNVREQSQLLTAHFKEHCEK